MLVGELEGLDEADGLLDRAADGQVVDGDLAEVPFGSMMNRPRRAMPSSSRRTP
jgi:hypothetical protein